MSDNSITHGMCDDCLKKFKEGKKVITNSCVGNIVPDSLVRDYELTLEEMSDREEQDWIDTHCGDCDTELDEDGQCPKCPKCTENYKYGGI